MDEIGWYSTEGMGSPVPLSWADLNHWKQVTETDVGTDDILLMRHLSKYYVSALNKGKDPSSPAPFTDMEKVNQDTVTNQALAWVSSFPTKSK